ncbi:MAG: hypothetical protein V4555_20890, partial [Acidobacteriota bacterium]
SEFENALQDPAVLTDLLTGHVTAGPLSILLETPQPSDSPCNSDFCRLVRDTTTPVLNALCNLGTPCSTGLIQTTIPYGGFKLSGALTATQAGSIVGVQSIAITCSNGDPLSKLSPSDCEKATAYYGTVPPPATIFLNHSFTETNVATNPNFPILHVNAGQIVQVSVTISFS